jgi:hypothetical protein
MPLNSLSIHALFISAVKSFDAAERRSVSKHSRHSDKKEVAHGYEEVEEEEDVEVTFHANPYIWVARRFGRHSGRLF